VGGDVPSKKVPLIDYTFQSTPPGREATDGASIVDDFFVISIHASWVGGDLFLRAPGTLR